MSDTHTTQHASTPPSQEQLDQLDHLLIELGRDPSPEATLVLEHLSGVRTYWVEYMPLELALNLELTRESLRPLPNPELKTRITGFLKIFR